MNTHEVAYVLSFVCRCLNYSASLTWNAHTCIQILCVLDNYVRMFEFCLFVEDIPTLIKHIDFQVEVASIKSSVYKNKSEGGNIGSLCS